MWANFRPRNKGIEALKAAGYTPVTYYDNGNAITRWDRDGSPAIVSIGGLEDDTIVIFEARDWDFARYYGVAKGWCADDLIGMAVQNNIVLTEAQAEYLLADWDSKLRDCSMAEWSGWDVINTRLEDVDICIEPGCNNAVDVLDDGSDASVMDSDSGEKVCPSCVKTHDYKQCATCTDYSPAVEMALLSHNPSEASYYHKECFPK